MADRWKFSTTAYLLKTLFAFRTESTDRLTVPASAQSHRAAMNVSSTSHTGTAQSGPGLTHRIPAAPVETQVPMTPYYKASKRSLTRSCSADRAAVPNYVDNNTLVNGTAAEEVAMKKWLLEAQPQAGSLTTP